MVHVEDLCTIGLIAVVATAAQTDLLAADLTDLEVDLIGSLNRAVVVKANNENINGQVGQRKCSNSTVDGNGLCSTNIPIGISQASRSDLADVFPRARVQSRTNGRQELCGDRNSLIGRCVVVCTSGNLDSDGRSTGLVIHAVDSQRITAYRDSGNTGVVRCCGNSTVTSTSHGYCCTLG